MRNFAVEQNTQNVQIEASIQPETVANLNRQILPTDHIQEPIILPTYPIQEPIFDPNISYDLRDELEALEAEEIGNVGINSNQENNGEQSREDSSSSNLQNSDPAVAQQNFIETDEVLPSEPVSNAENQGSSRSPSDSGIDLSINEENNPSTRQQINVQHNPAQSTPTESVQEPTTSHSDESATVDDDDLPNEDAWYPEFICQNTFKAPGHPYIFIFYNGLKRRKYICRACNIICQKTIGNFCGN